MYYAQSSKLQPNGTGGASNSFNVFAGYDTPATSQNYSNPSSCEWSGKVTIRGDPRGVCIGMARISSGPPSTGDPLNARNAGC